jgi:hypothetical protein
MCCLDKLDGFAEVNVGGENATGADQRKKSIAASLSTLKASVIDSQEPMKTNYAQKNLPE